MRGSPTDVALPAPANLAGLLKARFDGGDLAELRNDRTVRCQTDPQDAAALMDLCFIEQILGDPASGLRRLWEALRHHRIYRSSWPASPEALRVLAFMSPGDISANTPVEFLLQQFDVVLYMLYIVPGQPIPENVPDHDIAIVLASESDQVHGVMREIERVIPAWPCPVLNSPDRILRLSRENMFHMLRNVPGIVMPATARIHRANLEKLGRKLAPINWYLDGGEFPLIVRPVGSHAGRGLERLDDPAAIGAYLEAHREAEFYLSRFIDYRSADGQFRKYRIMWVDGLPYPCHMAIAGHWKIWYLNAGMDASAAKRSEEAEFLADFDQGFFLRHAQALNSLAERFGLEYVGIDCAELPDGRLLVFEGDIALVAHDMDPPDLYPYKCLPMRRLFSAFYEMLRRRSVCRTR